MSALVAITSGSAASITSAEIAELVGKRHDNVKRTIEALAQTGVIRSPQIEDSEEINNLGLPRKVRSYLFTGEQGKRDSIVVVAQLSPEFTARLVDRWQELERRSAAPALPDFTDPATAAIAWAEQYRAKSAAEAKVLTLETTVSELEPKAAFARQVEVAPDAITTAQAAKIIGTGRTRFMAWLREIHWCSRFNEPYQDKIEAGLLDVKLGSWDHPDHGLRQSVTTLITGKGLVKLQQMWAVREMSLSLLPLK